MTGEGKIKEYVELGLIGLGCERPGAGGEECLYVPRSGIA
jgi:hypothetical protein